MTLQEKTRDNLRKFGRLGRRAATPSPSGDAKNQKPPETAWRGKSVIIPDTHVSDTIIPDKNFIAGDTRINAPSIIREVHLGHGSSVQNKGRKKKHSAAKGIDGYGR